MVSITSNDQDFLIITKTCGFYKYTLLSGIGMGKRLSKMAEICYNAIAFMNGMIGCGGCRKNGFCSG